MTLAVEEAYPDGVPQTAVSGWAPPGAAWHWDANSLGGRAGWESTVRHLVNTRTTVNASYHGGFWHEHDTERTVLQWIVPTTKAAHSIAPSQVFQYNANKDRATQDVRFAEVRRILAEKASDPNAGCLAIAYSGMPAGLQRDLQCPVFRADVQNLAQQLVGHPSVIDRPHFGHGWIQPITRYEMDVASDFIGLLYDEQEGDDMTHFREMDAIYNRSATLASGATARSSPNFNPKNYDENAVFRLEKDSTGPAIGWVAGSNLTLGDGKVFDPRTRWLVTWSRGVGFVFWHERDLKALNLVEQTSGDVPVLQAALDAANASLDGANRRTAIVKTTGASALRKAAIAIRDTATGADAAATNLEKL